MGNSSSKSEGGSSSPSQHTYVTSILRRACQQYPNSVATIDAASGREHSYAQVEERVKKLAGGLKNAGLNKDSRVGVVMLNSDRYFELFFAVAWANGVVVPMNIRLAAPEMIDQFNDCQVEFVVVDDAFAEFAEKFRAQVPSIKQFIYAGEKKEPPVPSSSSSSSSSLHFLMYENLTTEAQPAEDSMRGGNETFGIFFTGGTSGKSKGVELTHGNIFVNALGHVATLHYSPSSRYLHSAPMFHLADGASTFGITMAAGSHVFIPRFDPEHMLHTVEKYEVNKAMMVPVMIQMMLNHPNQAQYNGETLQDIIYGASPMPEALLGPAMQKFPHARWHGAMGMTETSPAITNLGPEFHTPNNPKLRSVGRPVPWVEARIVDENDQPVARGVVGELVTRGPHVMKGYLNMPDATKKALKGGWMHTGDGAYMDEDGFIFIVDRLKDMIITGGENVYSAEVENAIMGQGKVAMCAVIGLSDEKFGEIVTAVVVAKPGEEASLSEKTIIDHCRERIAGYKVPKKVFFRNELPLSGAGKILKNELRKEFNVDTLGRNSSKSNL